MSQFIMTKEDAIGELLHQIILVPMLESSNGRIGRATDVLQYTTNEVTMDNDEHWQTLAMFALCAEEQDTFQSCLR